MTARRAGAAAFCLAAVLLVAGCGQKGEPAPAGPPSAVTATLRDIGGAPAALAVSEPMRPFFAAGLGSSSLAVWFSVWAAREAE